MLDGDDLDIVQIGGYRPPHLFVGSVLKICVNFHYIVNAEIFWADERL